MEEKNFDKMSKEELNTALYDKLSAEQDNYRNWLESQTAAEALKHAYEFIIREDILIALSDNDLSQTQVKALLQNSCTLDDIYKDWLNIETGYMDDIRNTIEERADIFIKQEQEKLVQFANVPIYTQNLAYAQAHNELELWKNSYKADIACRNAIELAIKENYSGFSLNTAKVIREVAPMFDIERVLFLLANTVRHKDWDGRISEDNKEWAKTVPAVADEKHSVSIIADGVHPVLLDALVNTARKLEPGYTLDNPTAKDKERPSILERLQQPKPPIQPSKSTLTKKRREPEL